MDAQKIIDCCEDSSAILVKNSITGEALSFFIKDAEVKEENE